MLQFILLYLNLQFTSMLYHTLSYFNFHSICPLKCNRLTQLEKELLTVLSLSSALPSLLL